MHRILSLPEWSMRSDKPESQSSTRCLHAIDSGALSALHTMSGHVCLVERVDLSRKRPGSQAIRGCMQSPSWQRAQRCGPWATRVSGIRGITCTCLWRRKDQAARGDAHVIGQHGTGRSTAQGPPENASLSRLHNCKGVLFPGAFRSKDIVLRLGAAISISLEKS